VSPSNSTGARTTSRSVDEVGAVTLDARTREMPGDVGALVLRENLAFGRQQIGADDTALLLQSADRLGRGIVVVERQSGGAVVGDDVRLRLELAHEAALVSGHVVTDERRRSDRQRQAAGEDQDQNELVLDREIAKQLHHFPRALSRLPILSHDLACELQKL
jgi:hypothetical protein